MNPGLVIKLRPTGPWRIGPDSGARNRVDSVYHSDSLYSAVTSAMARLGTLDEWLSATARSSAPAVCFSSCFPFLDEIGFVVPPRTIWPPASAALLSARVRWKSARFVPLGIVQAILAGQTLRDDDWNVDGPSECLVPAGRPGPFRTGVRWNAAVDRLTGATERHSTACIEFRAGAGLWTVASFADDAAGKRWREPVKAAFRLLADSGFGGERSRGWGRAEMPEFVEGTLPGMILGSGDGAQRQPEMPPRAEEPPTEVPPVEEPPVEPQPEPEPPEPTPERPASQLAPAFDSAFPFQDAPEPTPLAPGEPPPAAADLIPVETVPQPEHSLASEPSAPELPSAEPAPRPEYPLASAPPAPGAHRPGAELPHWLLSLFTPAGADAVDWSRGNYSLLARGGRIESPAGSGELKKQVRMVTEGSVIYAASAPRGAASDVAPDGFAHPVFRAGFALSIPLPEVS